MDKEITLIFHNQGLRTYIEVDLCAECPRQDDKGCCGYYSPVFYPTDLAYLSINKPEVVDHIFSLERLTILDHSVTVNNTPEGDSYRCRFHSKTGGCLLTQNTRESICRHFVCSGIAWWEENELSAWKQYMDDLTDYEIELNQRLSMALNDCGLNLRNPETRREYLSRLIELYNQEFYNTPSFIKEMQEKETFTLKRPLSFGADWGL